ncbi:hypothetical protein ACTXT7_011388 [Hymenolepis weldensis]
MTLYTIPESLFIRIRHDNASVSRPRSWSDVFYIPMRHNPYLSCLNRSINFPPFYDRPVSSKKYICTHVLSCPHPSDSFKAVFVFHSKDNVHV